MRNFEGLGETKHAAFPMENLVDVIVRGDSEYTECVVTDEEGNKKSIPVPTKWRVVVGPSGLSNGGPRWNHQTPPDQS